MKSQPLSQPLHLKTYPFQRGSSRFRLRHMNKKAHLTLKHILIFFILAGTLSYLASHLFLFLTTWEGLRVQQIRVRTERPQVEREIRESLGDVYTQNILQLDLGLVEKKILAHRWVKRAKIRKIFPSSLEIIIEERQPLAILHQAGQAYLVNEEGIKLEALSLEITAEFNLPAVYPADQKAELSKEDWQIISQCLEALSPEERPSASIFFYSRPTNLVLKLGHEPTRLILGKDHFQEKINLSRSYRPLIESAFGPLDYLDLRFWEDRIYFKTREPGQSPEITAIEEES
jgi:cell division septal protein FtsQ